MGKVLYKKFTSFVSLLPVKLNFTKALTRCLLANGVVPESGFALQ